jgi:hypothetical protein
MPTNTYTPIASVTLSATASEVVFSGLPQTFRDLILVMAPKRTTSGSNTIRVQFNGDSGSNYSWVTMSGNGSTASSSTGSDTNLLAGDIDSSYFNTQTVQIMDYSVTNKHKTVLVRRNRNDRTSADAGRWANTAAVTSIRIFDASSDTFTSGSTFTIFGVIA